MMQASWDGKVIAQSGDTIVVEGNHYFPKESVDQTVLQDSSTTSLCGWKGTAHYYSLSVNGQINRDAAFYYPDPKEAASAIKDHIAFWKGVEVSGA